MQQYRKWQHVWIRTVTGQDPHGVIQKLLEDDRAEVAIYDVADHDGVLHALEEPRTVIVPLNDLRPA